VRPGCHIVQNGSHAGIDRAVDVPDGGAQRCAGLPVVLRVSRVHEVPELMTYAVGLREHSEKEVPPLEREAMSKQRCLLLDACDQALPQIRVVLEGATLGIACVDGVTTEASHELPN
jgi:hypothetical protein